MIGIFSACVAVWWMIGLLLLEKYINRNLRRPIYHYHPTVIFLGLLGPFTVPVFVCFERRFRKKGVFR